LNSARRKLRITRGAELAAFETVEHSLGREETDAAFVAYDDTGGAVIDFDDIGSGHGCSFAGMPALLSDNDAGSNPIRSTTGSGRCREATSGKALARTLPKGNDAIFSSESAQVSPTMNGPFALLLEWRCSRTCPNKISLPRGVLDQR
jgi:hypothetical protein